MGKLVLTMKLNESIFIDFAGQRCEVLCAELRSGQVKLLFTAPLSVNIVREKIDGKPRRVER